MFSQEFLKSLDEPDTAPKPIERTEPVNVFAPTPPAKRGWAKPAAAVVIVMAVLGGVLAATQFDGERPMTEPKLIAVAKPKTVPEPVYHQAPATEQVKSCECGPNCKCDGPVCECPEPKAKESEPLPVVVKAEPVADPKPAMSAEEFERLVRERVIKERGERLAKIEDRQADEDAKELDNEFAGPAKEEPAPKTNGHTLTWVNGAKAKAPAAMLESLKDFRHEEVDAEGNSFDKYGPRVKFTGSDGLVYFVRAATFSDQTATKILTKFGLASHKDKFPQVDYPLNYRNRNLPDGGGCCVWASGSNLAYIHGYDFSLEDHRYGGASPQALHRVLTREKIPAVYTAAGRRNLAMLRDACDHGLGAAVGLQMAHYINVAGVDDTRVAIIDNNDRQLKVRTMPLNRFMAAWDGSMNVITPPAKSKEFLAKWRPNRWGQVNPNAPRDLSDEQMPPAFDGGETGQFPETGSFVGQAQFTVERVDGRLRITPGIVDAAFAANSFVPSPGSHDGDDRRRCAMEAVLEYEPELAKGVSPEYRKGVARGWDASFSDANPQPPPGGGEYKQGFADGVSAYRCVVDRSDESIQKFWRDAGYTREEIKEKLIRLHGQ